MMRCGSLVVALAIVAVVASTVLAEKKALTPSKEFKGSVEDANLAKDAPAVITSTKALEKIWKSWGITDKMPDVDFTKEIVITTTSVGSTIKIIASLDTDKGELMVGGLGTKDIRPGFRYVIAVVPSEGVKTVNGKELPKE